MQATKDGRFISKIAALMGVAVRGKSLGDLKNEILKCIDVQNQEALRRAWCAMDEFQKATCSSPPPTEVNPKDILREADDFISELCDGLLRELCTAGHLTTDTFEQVMYLATWGGQFERRLDTRKPANEKGEAGNA